MEEKRPDEMEMAKKKDEEGKEKKSKGIGMNKSFIFIISALFAAVFILTSCTPVREPTIYTFKEAFLDLAVIDAKYNTSLYTEALDKENYYIQFTPSELPDWNRTNILTKNVDLILNDLEMLKNKTISNKNINNSEGILLLIEAREKMIKSQELYKIGLSFGDKGRTRDGFGCKDKPTVLNASDAFNQSAVIGTEVTRSFDYLLNTYPSVGHYLLKSKRPKFYDSPIYFISREAARDRRNIEQLCKN